MPVGIINKSNELRKLIFQQSDRFNIPLLHICRKVRIDYEKFVSDYANIKDLQTGTVGISDGQLISIANLVGLDVRMVIVIKDDEQFEPIALQNKQMLKDEYTKEKGAFTKTKQVNSKAHKSI